MPPGPGAEEAAKLRASNSITDQRPQDPLLGEEIDAIYLNMFQNALIRFPPRRKEERDDSGFEFLASSSGEFRFLSLLTGGGNGIHPAG